VCPYETAGQEPPAEQCSRPNRQLGIDWERASEHEEPSTYGILRRNHKLKDMRRGMS
jgi:hypothetical protein